MHRRHVYARPSSTAPSALLTREFTRPTAPSSDPTHTYGTDDTVSVPINAERARAVSSPRRAAIRHAVREAYLRSHHPQR